MSYIAGASEKSFARSPLDDTDTLVLFLLHFNEVVHIDDKITIQEKNILKSLALAGLHAFPGNDYASIFLRKKRSKFWKMSWKYPSFLESLAALGSFPALPKGVEGKIEEFIYMTYRYPEAKNVDETGQLLSLKCKQRSL